MTIPACPDFLLEPSLKLILFGGKGGVGKTTCASIAALDRAARYPAKRGLLVSTDPAHSVTGVLADLALPDHLGVRELDAAASLQSFKSRHERLLAEIADRGTFLDKDDIQSLMDLSMPGMDEIAAYLDIAEWLRHDRYDWIVIDTAPTGHTLRLLDMPDLIRRWLVALDTLLAKHRYIRRQYTGDQSYDHLDRFLLDMTATVKLMQKLLRDERRCRFVLVMVAESMVVEESLDLAQTLGERHIAVPEILVNRMLPATDCPHCQEGRQRQWQALEHARRDLPAPVYWGLPLLPEEPRGAALQTLRFEAVPAGAAPPRAPRTLPVRVESPAALPAERLRLLIFAGKGGVGKTTLACATALWLAEQRPAARFLLFSTDPAHSLADALGLAVGPEPTPVRAGLDAQEIDAETAFGSIRQTYRQELERFLGEALPHLDFTFDREVMEHLLDIAPPGLDEIMALTAIMAHLDRGAYDAVIMDSAPSGHLVRLLSLPELIADWLKLFFSLLLKYRGVMRLPHISARLVELSRSIKAFRALLADAERTALYAVTIPTQLAFDKTVEMSDNLQKVGLRVSGLFINQITPASDCPLCTAVHRREMKQIDRAGLVFPGFPQTLIHHQTDPGGIAGLRRLGENLYRRERSSEAQLM